MKILVLGGSGHIGKRLLQTLAGCDWAEAVGATRHPVHGTAAAIAIDSCDLPALSAALRGFDAVVNCVAGDQRSISEGARVLVQAALAAQCPRIVHLSTMSVYGPVEGRIDESAWLDPGLGWYGRAKCEAEQHLSEFVRLGGAAVVLRPGCVFGPGSELWVGRVGRWLQAGRLGDLGLAGDGWSNLVHVDDVCQALLAALQLPLPAGAAPAFNLAAPDSPRWNDYFVDLALALQATPVARIAQRQLTFDAWLLSPALKAGQIALKAIGNRKPLLPDPLPPGLLRLWRQQIALDASRASVELGLRWTAYASSLQDGADWFCANERAPLNGKY